MSSCKLLTFFQVPYCGTLPMPSRSPMLLPQLGLAITVKCLQSLCRPSYATVMFDVQNKGNLFAMALRQLSCGKVLLADATALTPRGWALSEPVDPSSLEAKDVWPLFSFPGVLMTAALPEQDLSTAGGEQLARLPRSQNRAELDPSFHLPSFEAKSR